MALTLPEALKRSQNPLMAGIARSVVTTDQMSAVIPMEAVNADAIRFIREGALPTGGAFIDDTGTTSEESTGTDDRTVIHFRRIVGNMDVDRLANVMGGGQQRGNQLGKKVKATWRKVQQTFITGNRITSHTLAPATANPFNALSAFDYGPWLDSSRQGPGSIKYVHSTTTWSFRAPGDPTFGDGVVAAGNGTYTLKSHNPSKWIKVTITVASASADGETGIYFATTTNEFEGVNELINPSQVIAASGGNGDDYALSILDAMISKEKVDQNRAFIMNSKLIEKHYAVLRALGGTVPETMALPGYGRPVPTYRGIPLLQNDFIASNETVGGTTTATSIYLASLSADEGLFMGCPSLGGPAAIPDADPRVGPVMGFWVTDLGALEGKDHDRTRVAWYGCIGLKSDLALVRASGVKSV